MSSVPLHISEIRVGTVDNYGILGVASCPGTSSGRRGAGPAIETDVAAIVSWGANVVVSLTESSEFDLLGVSELPRQLSKNFRWIHLPVKDMSVPENDFLRKWSNEARSVHDVLTAGGKVLIHCRGGLGRSGLMASLILAERGASAQDAIEKVRAARPGAIETCEQEKWLVSRFSDLRVRAPLITASLLGGAMGDSLGADIEFLSLAEIRRLFPSGLKDLPPHYGIKGAVTDDTQMTLFTLEGLIRTYVRGATKGIAAPVGIIHHAYLRWLLTQGGEPAAKVDREHGIVVEKVFHAQRAPGNTCLSSLKNAKRFGGAARNDSKGCGTIMRTAPIALACRRNIVRQTAMEVSDLTHGHPTARVSAAAWSEILAKVAGGTSADRAAEDILNEYASVRSAYETLAAIRAALGAKRDARPETVETLGGGWIAEEALAIALYAALATENLEDGLRVAVLHSGDSDSTGAIAGNLLGLLYPEETLRHDWGSEIECREWICCMPYDLQRVMSASEVELDELWETYPGF